VKFVGERIRRLEDHRLLTGRGRYVGDLALPGMLDVVLVRSPHAHARIRRIDVEAAKIRPGVVDVVTFADLGDAGRPLPAGPPHVALRERNWTVLAGDRVRFVGEAVAAVVADGRARAEDAVDALRIEYEPLPSVQSVYAQTGAMVHEGLPDNLAGRVTLSSGDVARGLREAPRVLSERFRITRGGGVPLEPRGVVADCARMTGDLRIWVSSQAPHDVRRVVADLLDVPLHRVRVVAPDVGGGFGSKLIVYPEDVLVPFLALRLGRPVRWLEERSEHMLAATQEREQVHDVTVGFDQGGRLIALRDQFVHDNGAYTPRGLVVPLATASMLGGPYRIPNLEVTLCSMFTNRVPVTPYRGSGQPQAVFVIERVLDLVARATGRDRAAVRLTNLIRSEDMPYDTGLPKYRGGGSVVYDGGDFPGVLRETLGAARYEERRVACARARAEGRLAGIGIACYVEGTAVGPFEAATVRVEPSGRVVLVSGVPSQGQGIETTLAQICASELGLTPDEITMVLGDTGAIEDGIGTYASRAAVVGGSAVLLAARDLRTRIGQVAAAWLGAPEDEIEQHGSRFSVRTRPGHEVTLADLARATRAAPAGAAIPPVLEVTRYFRPSDLTYASGAQAVAVEIDPLTATARLLGCWITHDSGRLVNPMIVEGQIHGAAAQGIGGALLEELVFDDQGQLETGSLMDYALPRAADVPPLEIAHLETPSPTNPLGLKGVGESGILPVAAAVASAIEDALSGRGIQIREMPMTGARLRALLGTGGPQ
jgi:aerobic carbon-monoxide dehydrogenase large subunit